MIQPAEGFILAEPIKNEAERDQTTKSGIVLPTQKEDRPDLRVTKAKVLESGSKLYKRGDQIYYNYFSGNSIIKISKDALGEDDKEFHFVWEADILGREI